MKEKDFSRSLYLKLLGIYGLTFCLLLASLGLGFKISRQDTVEQDLRVNIENYANYLIKDIGNNPPNLDVARAIQKQTRLDMAIIGNGMTWGSSDKFIEQITKPKKFYFPWKKHATFKVEQNGYAFYISGHNFKMLENFWTGFFICLVLEILILLLSYKFIRYIFKPLDQMKTSINAFGEGKWDTRIEVECGKDFSGLATTMNTMAEKIERHFKNMRDLLLAISHELRTPLTRMKLALEFIPDQKIRDSLNEEIIALDRMTETLLERERLSSRPELLEKKSYPVSELLSSIVPAEVKLTIHAERDILVDKTRFELAIKNIIDNAFKHGKPPVEVNLYQDRLEILDHGHGIPSDQVQHLGQPFFRQNTARTSSRNSEGYGLGLSLSYSILRAHNLDITADSELGVGTRFVIAFPKA